MEVTLVEYAKMHNYKPDTVRNYVRRKQLQIIRREKGRTYVDSETPVITGYLKKYGKQPRLSNILRSMKARCNNSKNTNYNSYGARGIKVCDEWMNSTKAFIEWAYNNGYKEDLTIDRIDNDGNYCPENCRWITARENVIKSHSDRKIKKEKEWQIRKAELNAYYESIGDPFRITW